MNEITGQQGHQDLLTFFHMRLLCAQLRVLDAHLCWLGNSQGNPHSGPRAGTVLLCCGAGLGASECIGQA